MINKNQKGMIHFGLNAGDPISKIKASTLRKVEDALNNLSVEMRDDVTEVSFIKDAACKAWKIQLPSTSGSAYNLVVCTSVDSGGDGYHQFSQCGLDGVVTVDGSVYEDCWLIGDWTRGTWLPVEYGLSSGETPTYGKLYVIGETNAVEMLGSFYMD